MAPAIREIEAESFSEEWPWNSGGQARFEAVVCVTAQHKEMLDQGG